MSSDTTGYNVDTSRVHDSIHPGTKRKNERRKDMYKGKWTKEGTICTREYEQRNSNSVHDKTSMLIWLTLGFSIWTPAVLRRTVPWISRQNLRWHPCTIYIQAVSQHLVLSFSLCISPPTRQVRTQKILVPISPTDVSVGWEVLPALSPF